MIYIKLEENRDKFMKKYQNLPRTMTQLLFRAKCKNGKFEIQKENQLECIILPEVNEKIMKRLEILARIRCWKNVCVSDNLENDEKIQAFVKKNELKMMNGRWLFTFLLEQILEYIVDVKNEGISNQEVSILCHQLDEVLAEKIKEIARKVRVCNILTKNSKQYRKLEEEMYQENGVILNVSNNVKKTLMKSNMIINYDFSAKDLEKCSFPKKVECINLVPKIKMDKQDMGGRNIIFYEIDMPVKYKEYEKFLEGFNHAILYESFIYKNTSYRNIQKELKEDDVKILYLKDSENRMIKKENFILSKTLDKISN